MDTGFHNYILMFWKYTSLFYLIPIYNDDQTRLLALTKTKPAVYTRLVSLSSI